MVYKCLFLIASTPWCIIIFYYILIWDLEKRPSTPTFKCYYSFEYVKVKWSKFFFYNFSRYNEIYYISYRNTILLYDKYSLRHIACLLLWEIVVLCDKNKMSKRKFNYLKYLKLHVLIVNYYFWNFILWTLIYYRLKNCTIGFVIFV